jgi:predicted Zn-dependent protease
VLKAVVAAAAEHLCLTGESADGLMLLNSNDRESLTAICELKDDASRADSSAAVKAASVTDLSDLKRFVKTQYATGLNNTNGKPRCDAAARKAIGNGLWAHFYLLAAAVDLSGVVKELRPPSEAAFVAEAGDKARVCWNQSGNSETAKIRTMLYGVFVDVLAEKTE